MTGFRILEYKPLNAGALTAVVVVQLQSGLVLRDVGIFRSGEKRWASLSKPVLGADGAIRTDERGRRQYTQLLAFANDRVKESFHRQLFDALDAMHGAPANNNGPRRAKPSPAPRHPVVDDSDIDDSGTLDAMWREGGGQ